VGVPTPCNLVGGHGCFRGTFQWYTENGGSIFFLNVAIHLQYDTGSTQRIPQSEQSNKQFKLDQ
jgi:hypothetical protein